MHTHLINNAHTQVIIRGITNRPTEVPVELEFSAIVPRPDFNISGLIRVGISGNPEVAWIESCEIHYHGVNYEDHGEFIVTCARRWISDVPEAKRAFDTSKPVVIVQHSSNSSFQEVGELRTDGTRYLRTALTAVEELMEATENETPLWTFLENLSIRLNGHIGYRESQLRKMAM